MNDQKQKVNIKLYEFQLEQVQDHLKSDPTNQKLLLLKRKIQDLLNIATVETITITTNTTANTIVQKSKELKKGIVASTITNNDTFLNGNIGDLVEAKCHQDNQWWEAKIQNFLPDRSMFTVLFTGFPESQHCTPKEIRLHNPLSKQLKPTKTIISGDGNVNNKRSFTSSTSSSFSSFSSHSKETSHQKKSKPTKQEYLEKKENEQKEKQESWKNFQQKIKKKI